MAEFVEANQTIEIPQHMSFEYDRSFLQRSFQSATPIFQDGDLWVDGTLQVSLWEEIVQKKAAELLALSKPKNILEIGYGLGMFSEALRSMIGDTQYTILEANLEIAKLASRRLVTSRNTRVVCDFWENFTSQPSLPRFDAVYFDSYLPLNDNACTSLLTQPEVHSHLLTAMPSIASIMKSSGLFSFLDTTRLVDFSSKELLALGFEHYSTFSVDVEISESCPFANGRGVNIIQLRKV